MKKLFVAIGIIIGASFSLQAQSYQHAIGLRGGNPAGVTYKQSLGGEKYVEGIVATRWKGLNVTGLLEFQKTPWAEPGLAWYYGVGAHIGLYSGGNTPWAKDNEDYSVIGIDGIIGLEYTIPSAPLNFSLDYKPSFNIFGYKGAWFDGTALSIRYTF